MKCAMCDKPIGSVAFTYVYTYETGPNSGPVSMCGFCLDVLIGSAASRKLKQKWRDAPYVQLPLREA